NVIEMSISKLILLAGRMQRIAQEHESANAVGIRRDIRSHTAAHGLASDDDRARSMLRGDFLDNLSIQRLHLRLGIRHLPMLLHIFEVELHGEESMLRQCLV